MHRLGELTPNMFVKPHVRLSVLDCVVLLANALKANENDEVGWEDAGRTITDLTAALGRKSARTEESLLESTLWACNLMNENGQFWHPENKSFDEFLAGVVPKGKKFNKFLNYLED